MKSYKKEDNKWRAVVYLRSASAPQKEPYRSLARQRYYCKVQAAQLGATVSAEYADRGMSGMNLERPGLQALLARLEQQPAIDYVLATDIARLSRSTADFAQINQAITESGAQLVFCSSDAKDLAANQLHDVVATMARHYSAALAEATKDGLNRKAQAGIIPGRVPLGYCNIQTVHDGRLVRSVEVDPKRAPHITWVFETFAQGQHTIAALTDALAARGLTTRPTTHRPAHPLSTRQVRSLLTNPTYTGLVIFDGHEFPGTHDPLVDSDCFQAVQAALAGSASTGQRVAP